MLKSNFFSAKNFNIFYDFSRKKKSYIGDSFTDKAKKISDQAKKISNFRCISRLILAKKRGENPVFRALSSSLVQRYNIFPRNPNRVNISQHFGNVKIEFFYLEFIMMAVSMKRQCTARCSQRVAPRNYCTIGGVAIAAPSYSLYIRCHFRGTTRCKQRAVHCLAMGTNSFSIRN